MKKITLIERLEHTDMYIDAIDEAITEIEDLRDVVKTLLEVIDHHCSSFVVRYYTTELSKARSMIAKDR